MNIKTVYQARPKNNTGMVFNGYMDTCDQRPVEVLKAEIEARERMEYDMVEVLDVSGIESEFCKITY